LTGFDPQTSVVLPRPQGAPPGAEAAGWIAVDWGTTRLRAWAMRGSRVLAGAGSGDGMGTLDPGRFEPALLDLIGPWLTPDRRTTVVACGMVGARQGWIEAPYIPVPAPPLSNGTVRAPASDPRLDVRIVPGLKQARPADVMRGEETQIAGFLAGAAGFDGVLCLPGTHTKWAAVSAGEVTEFSTFMTGELFGLLAKHSVLRPYVDADWDAEVFAKAVGAARARPEALAAELFTIRAESLLTGSGGGAARLSGLLIGAELAGAAVHFADRPVALIGEAGLAGHYAAALALQGVTAEIADATACTLAGLSAAQMGLEEAAP